MSRIVRETTTFSMGCKPGCIISFGPGKIVIVDASVGGIVAHASDFFNDAGCVSGTNRHNVRHLN